VFLSGPPGHIVGPITTNGSSEHLFPCTKKPFGGLDDKNNVYGGKEHLENMILYYLSDAVYLLVHLGAMVITFLTGASDRECHTGRMPGADASHLAQTFVSLALKLACVPARRHSYK